MSEHTHTGKVSEGWTQRWVRLPKDWPPGVEVTVTWTKPEPEPEGRWVVDDGEPIWETGRGSLLLLRDLYAPDTRYNDAVAAQAALVDLIESGEVSS